MKSNPSELERQERKLRNIRWYQILMSCFLIATFTFMILWVVTLVKLRAQQKLRGDFNQISLVIRITEQVPDDSGEGKLLCTQEEAFSLYGGPLLAKDYYGQSLAVVLNQHPAFFKLDGGMIKGVNILGNHYNGDWIIYSYSDPNVSQDHKVSRGVNDLLLDRVNIFTFQFRAPGFRIWD